MGIKIKKFNESIDYDDFEMYFQDLKDDFPHIKWRFDKKSIELIFKRLRSGPCNHNSGSTDQCITTYTTRNMDQ